MHQLVGGKNIWFDYESFDSCFNVFKYIYQAHSEGNGIELFNNTQTSIAF